MTERAEETKRAYENGEPVLALALTNLVIEEYEEEKAEEYAKGRAHEHYHFLFEENNGHPIDFARLCYLDGRKDYRKEQEKKDIGFCEVIERQQEEIARLKEEIIELKKSLKLERALKKEARAPLQDIPFRLKSS